MIKILITYFLICYFIMKKRLFIISFFLGILCSYSQELPIEEQETDAIIDRFFENDTFIEDLKKSLEKFQFMYASVDYSNNTYFSGRETGIDQYTIRPQLTYLNSTGLFASISAYYYSEYNPPLDLTIASLGYTKNFGKQKVFKFSTSYSKYFYNNSITNVFSNDLSVCFGVRNKKRTLFTQLTGSYLFGKDNSIQLSSVSYASLKILNGKKYKLVLKPEFTIIAGEQTIELAQIYYENGLPITNYIENNVFEFINYQFHIPLHFTYNSYDFEVGFTQNFPSEIGEETQLKNTSFINVSVGYLIDL